MRYVTVCENRGKRRDSCTDFRMQPGTAWRIDDDNRDHHVVEVSEAQAKRACYQGIMRWVDGRTVAEFAVEGDILAQPVIEDARAKERRLGSSRKLRTPRRQAPGVAPEAPAAHEVGPPDPGEDEPRARGRRPRALEDGPVRHRKRGGPRGGLKLEL